MPVAARLADGSRAFLAAASVAEASTVFSLAVARSALLASPSAMSACSNVSVNTSRHPISPTDAVLSAANSLRNSVPRPVSGRSYLPYIPHAESVAAATAAAITSIHLIVLPPRLFLH